LPDFILFLLGKKGVPITRNPGNIPRLCRG